MRKYTVLAVELQFGVIGYTNALFLLWLPTYLSEAHNFSLNSMGFSASLPWLAIDLVVFFGGRFSDKLFTKGKSRMATRGVPAMIGLAIYAISLYHATITSTPWLNIVWLTLALGGLAAPNLASWAIANEKGGQFAGTLSGWIAQQIFFRIIHCETGSFTQISCPSTSPPPALMLKKEFFSQRHLSTTILLINQ